MNREILFKGKRKDTKEWVFGHLMQGADITLIIPEGKEFFYDELEKFAFDMTAYEVIPETVGQYTGLKDKNGKKIFEGDISKDKLVVTYIPQKASFCLAKSGWLFAHFFDEAIKVENGVAEIEIIGNIHDTPELLEEPS